MVSSTVILRTWASAGLQSRARAATRERRSAAFFLCQDCKVLIRLGLGGGYPGRSGQNPEDKGVMGKILWNKELEG
jgi:hypothetical protein